MSPINSMDVGRLCIVILVTHIYNSSAVSIILTYRILLIHIFLFFSTPYIYRMSDILGGLLQAPFQLMQMPMQMMGGFFGGGGSGGDSGGFAGMLGSSFTSMIMPLVIVGVGVTLVFKILDKL